MRRRVPTINCVAIRRYNQDLLVKETALTIEVGISSLYRNTKKAVIVIQAINYDFPLNAPAAASIEITKEQEIRLTRE